MQSVASAQPSVRCANKIGGDKNSGGDQESQARDEAESCPTHKGRVTKLLPTFASMFFLAASNCFATTVWPSDGTETGHNFAGGSVQWVHDNQAQNGDTITLPNGTFSWLAPLNITKGITLQGQTSITGAGTANPVIIDGTVIRDNTPRSGSGARIISVNIGSNQSFRLTGIHFSTGGSITYAISDGFVHFHSSDATPNTSMRMDHCYFDHLYQAKLFQGTGWIYGLLDHNVMDCRVTTSLYFGLAAYGGTNQISGNGAWADYSWYGSEKFFFVEDNTIRGAGGNVLSGGTDADHGARCVFRHNYFHNALIGNHGTESIIRGMRCYEVYNNVFHWTISPGAAAQRSGGAIWHDNTWTGVENGLNTHSSINLFRETGGVTAGTAFHPAAVSPWDMNDTEGNGTYVEGHAPFLFASGTDTSSVNSQGVIHDSTKTWTTDRWRGYSIRNMNPSAPSYLKSAFVRSNTSNTITYIFYPDTDRGPRIIFNFGDAYDIHRVLTAVDQAGHGKG